MLTHWTENDDVSCALSGEACVTAMQWYPLHPVYPVSLLHSFSPLSHFAHPPLSSSLQQSAVWLSFVTSVAHTHPTVLANAAAAPISCHQLHAANLNVCAMS